MTPSRLDSWTDSETKSATSEREAHPFSAAFEPEGEVRRYERHWTPVHLDFIVADLAAAVSRAEAAGALREGAIREYSWGDVALFSDPFGNGFCFIQFKGGGYDEIGSEEA